MFVWMAKFGAAYGVRTGIHVGVDVLINRMSDSRRAKFIVVGLLAGALFTGIVGALGATFVWENGAHHAIFRVLGIATDTPEGPTTPDLEAPTWIVYSAVPLGSFLMCFRFLQVTRGFIRTGELPRHDASKVEGSTNRPRRRAATICIRATRGAAMSTAFIFVLLSRSCSPACRSRSRSASRSSRSCS
jgi:C4-dicarboxylate transporter DctQ subunit